MRGSIPTIEAILGVTTNPDLPTVREAFTTVPHRVRKRHEFSAGTRNRG
ncbi:hypothetical protein A2U01_0075162 [Trifolium medium]|uniref:Uncharacterized protein n=1 Tax=Trifolium medium TaxID=97028 RepID=A0A392T0S1_9FABA|nr:hypothetical protein [Trifolium medium]